jgi:hypothetical protein
MAGINGLQRVTLSLTNLLADRMQRTDASVTYGIPRTGTTNTSARLNLFLYQIRENPAFRNDEDPRRAVPDMLGSPPLALELSYILTSYGIGTATITGVPNNTPADSVAELDAQEVLADAMRVLHDVPIITAHTPRLRPPAGNLLDSALQNEYESIRITPRTLTLDDLSRLWTALKEDYQRSAAYEVSVIRIEATRSQKANPPVLQRSIPVVPSIVFPPTLDDIQPDVVAATEDMFLTGTGLDDPSLKAIVSDALRSGFPAAPKTIAVTSDAAGLHFAFPNDAANYMPGNKTVQASVTDGTGRVHFTAPRMASLIPKITNINPATGPFNGTVTVTITGTLLGLAPVTNQPQGPLVPTVMFGSYAIPVGDVDYSGLPNQIKVKLSTPGPDVVAPPLTGQKVPVRVRANGVESRSWRVNPGTGLLEMDPAMLFTVT